MQRLNKAFLLSFNTTCLFSSVAELIYLFLWRYCMSTIKLEAQSRADKGKGASRRLRRLENKIPAVLYGGDKPPQAIHLLHNKVIKALETESIYSSVFDLSLDGIVEPVVLKDLQRHPYKPVILHMDLQRVGAKDVLTKSVPVHFTHQDTAPGVKAGGFVTHTMSQVEIRCEAQFLPEFIEVDLSTMAMNDVLHLSDLQLPPNVHLADNHHDCAHDHPVVSIHASTVDVGAQDTDTMAERIIEDASEEGRVE
jgi:large subunit ribosomal protein L25